MTTRLLPPLVVAVVAALTAGLAGAEPVLVVEVVLVPLLLAVPVGLVLRLAANRTADRGAAPTSSGPPGPHGEVAARVRAATASRYDAMTLLAPVVTPVVHESLRELDVDPADAAAVRDAVGPVLAELVTARPDRRHDRDRPGIDAHLLAAELERLERG